MDGISVVICCHNSAKLLPETLKHLFCQSLDNKIEWEIIIVNNNSSDNTNDVALAESHKYEAANGRLKIVDESNPGLTNARKKGLTTAKFDLIIFCDDDNWLCRDYLQIAYDKMKLNQNIGVLGGLSLVVNGKKLPDWWEGYRHGYAVGEQATHTSVLTNNLYIWGAGMVSKKAILLNVFDDRHPFILSDRKGVELSSGGDVEICKRVKLLGFELYYEKSLVLFHNISGERLSVAYRDKMFEGHGKGVEILKLYDQVIVLSQLTIVSKIFNVFKEIIKIGTKPFRKNQNNQDSLNRLATLLMLPGIAGNSACKMILNFKRDISL